MNIANFLCLLWDLEVGGENFYYIQKLVSSVLNNSRKFHVPSFNRELLRIFLKISLLLYVQIVV